MGVFSFFTKPFVGVSKLKAGAVGIVFVLVLLFGLLLWHNHKVSALEEKFFKAGQDQVRLDVAKAENRSLLIQREKIITLSNDLEVARNAHANVAKALGDARRNAVVSGQRVRNAATTSGGELDQRIAIAECSVVRTFAAKAFRAAAACRDNFAEIGLGTGGLVEASASSYYEHDRAEAVIKFTTKAPARWGTTDLDRAISAQPPTNLLESKQ